MALPFAGARARAERRARPGAAARVCCCSALLALVLGLALGPRDEHVGPADLCARRARRAGAAQSLRRGRSRPRRVARGGWSVGRWCLPRRVPRVPPLPSALRGVFDGVQRWEREADAVRRLPDDPRALPLRDRLRACCSTSGPRATRTRWSRTARLALRSWDRFARFRELRRLLVRPSRAFGLGRVVRRPRRCSSPRRSPWLGAGRRPRSSSRSRR